MTTTLDAEPVVISPPGRCVVTDADGSELEVRRRGGFWHLTVGRQRTEGIDLTDTAALALAERIIELIGQPLPPRVDDAVRRIRAWTEHQPPNLPYVAAAAADLRAQLPDDSLFAYQLRAIRAALRQAEEVLA